MDDWAASGSICGLPHRTIAHRETARHSSLCWKTLTPQERSMQSGHDEGPDEGEDGTGMRLVSFCHLTQPKDCMKQGLDGLVILLAKPPSP